MFDSRCHMSEADPRYGKILSGSALYRGQHVSIGEVETEISKYCNKNSANFVEWIPDSVMTSVCQVNSSVMTTDTSALFVSN